MSSHFPRVSIVTPSFQQAQYLEQTIRSVLGQGYPDLEYIIVDGGSTDESVEIIKRYASRLAWWVSQPDKGQSDAISKGFARATGDIVAWLNSDDMYAPGALQTAAAVMQRYPDVGLVYGDAVSINQYGRPLNDMAFPKMSLADLAAFEIICQPAVFIRRSVLAQVGPVNPEYRYLMDHELWLRIALKAPIRHIEKQVLAFARQHPAAKNVAQAAGFGAEALRILAWMRTQPDYSGLFRRQAARMEAGAERFNARYLLDGGLAWPAFRSYLRSIRLDPPTGLKEWHRLVFAAFSLVGLKRLGPMYYRIRQRSLPASMREMNIENVSSLYP